MPRILIASDADWILDELRASLLAPGTEVLSTKRGADVLPAVQAQQPDAVVLDFQIGNMGAGAICRELRHEEESGRMHHRPVVVLLDRADDAFLARRSGADAWLPKPVRPRSLMKTLETLLSGGAWSPGDAGAPRTG